MRFRDACPTCFIEKGFSVEMKRREDGSFECPIDDNHKFTRNEKGYWEKVR